MATKTVVKRVVRLHHLANQSGGNLPLPSASLNQIWLGSSAVERQDACGWFGWMHTPFHLRGFDSHPDHQLPLGERVYDCIYLSPVLLY